MTSVKILDNKIIDNLSYEVDGINIAYDMLGNAGIKLVEGVFEMTQDDFNWWKNYFLLLEILDKEEVSNEDLEFIKEHECVVSCTYEGYEFGHGGNYLYHVVLEDDDTIYSITTKK